ncbi:MAG: AAA family ATPase [Rhodothermales bacterium]
MILLIGIEKGGTGKSTLATNLATLRTRAGRDVLLVDADKQMTSSYWAARRDELGHTPRIVCTQKRGKAIHEDLRDFAQRYDDIIVDAGGQDSLELRSAMVVADRLCIPFQPSQADMWTLETMAELVTQVGLINPGLDVQVVINRATTHPRVPEVEEAVAGLADFPELPYADVVLRERRAFRKAMTLGIAVAELDPPDAKAIAELDHLYQTLYADA